MPAPEPRRQRRDTRLVNEHLGTAPPLALAIPARPRGADANDSLARSQVPEGIMTRVVSRSRLVVVLALLALTAPAPASEPALVINGGQLFDAHSGTLRPNQALVIEGERIKAAGTPDKPVTIPPGARVLDARGKVLIPGLIDAHTHLVLHVSAPDGRTATAHPHLTSGEILPLFLANGVTSLRCIGDETVALAAAAQYARARPELCPRVFLCSPLIDGEPAFHRYAGKAVTDAAQVGPFLDDLAGWGVTTLKIYVGTDRGVGRKVIEEGHKRGFVISGHLGRYSAQDAVADGIDGLEHIWSVFNYIIPPEAAKRADHRATLDLHNPQAKALIALLAQRKVVVDPTLVVFRNMLLLPDTDEIFNHPDNARVPKRMLAYWHQYPNRSRLSPNTREARRQELQKYKDLTGILHKAGVPILAGSDTPCPYVPPGFSMHQELELLVESGLSPAAALQSATLVNARALKQADHLGSLEAGKLADLVVLDADPVADVRNTRKIYRVVRGGRVCDPKVLYEAVPAE